MTDFTKTLHNLCDDVITLIGREQTHLGEWHAAVIAVLDHALGHPDYGDATPLEVHKQHRLEFEWAEELKQYGILLRDITLRKFKGMYGGEGVPLGSAYDLVKRATESLTSLLSDIDSTNSVDEAKASVWHHQKSPGVVVKEQVIRLKQQINDIVAANSELKKVERDILAYKTELLQTGESYVDNLNDLEQTFTRLKLNFEDLEVNPSKENLTNLVKTLEADYNHLDELQNNNDRRDTQFDKYDTVKVPMSVNGGSLVTKQIAFNDQINTWVEMHALPDILQTEQDVEQLDNASLLTVVNLKNNLTHLSGKDELIEGFDKSEYIRNIESQLSKIETAKIRVEQSQADYAQKINDNLKISDVFSDEKIFLTSSTEVMLSNYTKEGNKLFNRLPSNRVSQWFNTLFDRVVASDKRIAKSKDRHTQFVGYLRKLSLENVDKYHQSLFCNDGLLGLTFYRPRHGFDRLITQSAKNWVSGYPTALMVYGNYLSGKSTLLDLVPSLLPSYDVITLKVNEPSQYKGYKIDETTEFDAIFKTLNRHTFGEKVVIVIDDLEKWCTDKTQFLSNVATLRDMMLKYSKRYMFVISTNHYLKQDLDLFLDFSTVFTDEYCTDHMDVDSIAAAVKVRHHASLKHDQTTSSDDEELVAQVNQLAKLNDFNIGATLHDWIRVGIQHRDMEYKCDYLEEVVDKYKELFIYILKWGSVKESEFMQLTDGVAGNQINRELHWLKVNNILRRQLDGSLEIPPYNIHAIQQILVNQDRITNYGL